MPKSLEDRLKSVAVKEDTKRLAMFCKRFLQEVNPEIYKTANVGRKTRNELPSMDFVVSQALTYFKTNLILKYPNQYEAIKELDTFG